MEKRIIKHVKFIEELLGKKLSESKKLHLGCGVNYREGWLNVDLSDHPDIKKIRK